MKDKFPKSSNTKWTNGLLLACFGVLPFDALCHSSLEPAYLPGTAHSAVWSNTSEPRIEGQKHSQFGALLGLFRSTAFSDSQAKNLKKSLNPVNDDLSSHYTLLSQDKLLQNPKKDNPQELATKFAATWKDGLAEHYKNQFPLFQSFKSGLNFNIDLNPKRKKTTKKVDNVKYGLKLVKIQAPDREALIAATPSADIRDFPRSQVKWTILQKNALQTSNILENNAEKEDSWDGPSLKFKGIVEPQLSKNPQEPPGLKIAFYQETSLYQYEQTTDSSLKHQSSSHNVNVPLKSNLKLHRKWSDKGKIITSEISNTKTFSKTSILFHLRHHEKNDDLEYHCKVAMDGKKIGINAINNRHKLAHDQTKYNLELEVAF